MKEEIKISKLLNAVLIRRSPSLGLSISGLWFQCPAGELGVRLLCGAGVLKLCVLGERTD